MPKVSVIVPVYQVEAYLSECLDSILAQTFEDFELILVDDGTRDACPEIMREYAQRDARIREIHKPNGGLSSARNAGLEVARGEYIAFVDSDDRARPAMLADTVAAAERTGAQLVLFNYRKFDERGMQAPALPMRDEVIPLAGRGLVSYFYHRWMPYTHGQEAWCRLYRRDLIEANGLRFAPNDEVFAEDTLFSAMTLMRAHTLAALKADYIEYRQRGDSLMAMRKPRLCARLINLSIRLCEDARRAGKADLLENVLPVLCYDKLICKGIRFDPSYDDVLEALASAGENETMRALMRRLAGPWPLLSYTAHTGRGFRTQWRGRAFAAAWLRGDFARAAALVEGREGT